MFKEEKKVIYRYWADKKLKTCREEQNISMAKISKALRVSKGYYCRIENGQISINDTTAAKIVELLSKKTISNN